MPGEASGRSVFPCPSASEAVGWDGIVGCGGAGGRDGAVGCGGIVGDTPAGPAMPGIGLAPGPLRAVLVPLASSASAAPNSPSAARAWEIRICSMVRSCRISARLQARSASSHMVVRWTGLVPVTSASATIAPLGARSRPPR